MKKLRKSLGNEGFTLVELIIVIAIIAALVAILAPQYVKYVEKSRLAADKNTASTLLTEVQTAVADAATDGTSITDGTITMDADGTSETGSGNISSSLTTTDPNWESGKVTNKTASDGFDTYTITYTATNATGAWS